MTDLLDLVLEAHGGLEKWRRAQTITARFSMRGALLDAKQHPDGFRDARIQTDVRQPHVMISPFPHNGSRGIFHAGNVWIESDQGAITSKLDRARETFIGHERATPWTDLQFLYFAGYAFQNYLSMPYLLASDGVKVSELPPHREHGDTWRVLEVEFPKWMDVHCTNQRFYFNDEGLLVRNDYAPDVSPRGVSHYTYDHRVFDGFVFPTHRRVVLRTEDGQTLLTGPSVFLIDIDSIVVSDQSH